MQNKTLRTLTRMLALASVAISPMQSRAGVTADLGYVAAEEKSNSYLESNYSANLPAGVRASGFMDFNNNDQGYFGKTALTVPMAKGLELRAQAVSVNSPISEVGLGLSASIPNLPKRLFVSANVMPGWADSDGLKKIDSTKVGYFASLDLPGNVGVWTCGEVQPFQSEGATWAYGETEVNKTIGNWKFGVNAAMKSAGAGVIIPELSPRAIIRYQLSF